MQNRKPLYIVIVVGLLIIGGILFNLLGSKDGTDTVAVDDFSNRGVAGEPIDVALDFFGVWLEARQSTTTDPYTEKLTDRMEVSESVGKKLVESEAAFRESGFDPVLCQTEVPSKLRAKAVYENESEAQMLIMPKEKEGGIQSVVTLRSNGEVWVVTDISCSAGEQAPEQGEFSFEKEGFLLKQSVQPPLDSQYWHLVFEQNGVMGFTAPLFFSDTSLCSISGDEKVCEDSHLMEVMKVKVQGSMTEAGVDVARLTLLPE